MAKRASTSIPAMVQAVFSDRAPGPAAAGAVPPAGAAAPHRWQKRACADSSAWQARQVRVPSEAPQVLQKLPVPGVPQAGQGRVVAGGVIGGKSNPGRGFAGRGGAA